MGTHNVSEQCVKCTFKLYSITHLNKSTPLFEIAVLCNMYIVLMTNCIKKSSCFYTYKFIIKFFYQYFATFKYLYFTYETEKAVLRRLSNIR